MAIRDNLVLHYGMRKNKNRKSAGFGNFYSEVVQREGLSQRGFIDHVAKHVIGVPRPLVAAVIGQISQCIPELLSQGVSVKIDKLGVFFPTVHSKGVDDPLKYNPATDVLGVRMRFRPDSTMDDDLTSLKFKRLASPELAGVFTEVTTRAPEAEGGEEIKTTQLLSYSDWLKTVGV